MEEGRSDDAFIQYVPIPEAGMQALALVISSLRIQGHSLSPDKATPTHEWVNANARQGGSSGVHGGWKGHKAEHRYLVLQSWRRDAGRAAESSLL